MTTSNYFYFSVHKPEGINAYLNSFPKLNNTQPGGVGSKGVSATVAWSGDKGGNIPVTPFHNQSIGFELDPNEIAIPQADTLAHFSGSRVVNEYPKHLAICYSWDMGQPYTNLQFHKVEVINDHATASKNSMLSHCQENILYVKKAQNNDGIVFYFKKRRIVF